MSRRRLSPLARMAMQVAGQLQPDAPACRCVFGSRHGEIRSTAAMLAALAEEQPLSPAAFSHSVHNALPGLWSILQGQTGETSAVAAGRDTLPMALLEAQGMLAYDPRTPVLVIVADETLPPEFAAFADEPGEPYALGLLLESGNPNLRLHALSERGDACRDPVLAWQSWWLGESATLCLAGENMAWQWERV